MDVTEAWLDKIGSIMVDGRTVNPRQRETKELSPSSFTFDMTRPVLNNRARKLGYKFMLAEAAWIMSGMNTVRDIAPFSNRISEFSDDGFFFKGAYGPKVVDQLPYVVETLAKDTSSRQAVINIWRENPRGSKDVPCTLSLQFLIRDQTLNCVATMRSSDAWLGLPYDSFNFTMISSGVILLYRSMTGKYLELGSLTINAGSGHIYADNYKGVTECLKDRCPAFERDVDASLIFRDLSIVSYHHLVDYLWECARATTRNFSGFLAPISEGAQN